MLSRTIITRGSDCAFKIYLRDQDGNPYDLTGYTALQLRLPMDPVGAVAVTDAVQPAVNASATYHGTVFTAVTAGIIGDSITLAFDGTMTIAAVVAAWNAANSSNQVVAAGDNTLVLAAGSVTLDQGSDPYQKLTAVTPLELGTISVNLREADTALLKIGKNMTIELTVDRDPPAGNRKIILLKEAVTVEQRFF